MCLWKDYLPSSSQVLILAVSTIEEGERGPVRSKVAQWKYGPGQHRNNDGICEGVKKGQMGKFNYKYPNVSIDGFKWQTPVEPVHRQGHHSASSSPGGNHAVVDRRDSPIQLFRDCVEVQPCSTKCHHQWSWFVLSFIHFNEVPHPVHPVKKSLTSVLMGKQTIQSLSVPLLFTQPWIDDLHGRPTC